MLRDSLVIGATVLLGGAALVVVTAAVEALWAEAGLVDPLALGVVVLLAIPAAGSVLVPAAVAAGPVVALARWVEEGAWTGASVTGHALRDLLPAALLIGLLGGALTAGATLWAEPAARRAARDALDGAVHGAALRPGVELGAGDRTVTAAGTDGEGATDLFLTAGDLRVSAARGRLVTTGDGPVLLLEDGVATGGRRVPWRATFRSWAAALPAAVPRRLDLAERTNAELVEVARRTEEGGRDASYERAVLAKRFLHPLAASLLPAALLPLGLARLPLLGVGTAALGYLVAVRAGDHLATSIGPLAAAGTGPLLVGLVAGLAWARWGRA